MSPPVPMIVSLACLLAACILVAACASNREENNQDAVGPVASDAGPTTGPATPPTPPQSESPPESWLVGSPAPDFSLQNESDTTVRLRDASGRWVVLYFYPKDDTPGCTVEGRDFTSLLDSFTDAGAQVYGVSADSPESHRAFRAKCGLTVSLLSDSDHTMMTAYGACEIGAGPDGAPRHRIIRSTVIIDPAGTIRAHWPGVSVQGHAAEVFERLQALQSSGSQ